VSFENNRLSSGDGVEVKSAHGACPLGRFMKLSSRQKYDYRDLDRGEAQLMRVGHALWRDRRKLGDTVAEREGINAALESVWKAKREYRVELAQRRALRFSQFRETKWEVK
jgi:hypothetical protein